MDNDYRPSAVTVLDQLEPGFEIGPDDNRFVLLRKIGGGGMGQVWLARDLLEEKLEGGEHYKALKVINPQLQDSPRALAALQREALRAAKLAHPNIINVYGLRQGSDGWPFVIMDYLQGRDLDRLLGEEGQLSWSRTLELLQPVAAALDYAHAKHGLIHRDLKPGNVFITDTNEVKLLDFGLAYRLRLSRVVVNIQSLDSSGTPEYMPPEAFAAGEPEPTQDVYALACLAYEMLVGQPPYAREAAMLRSPDLLPSQPTALTAAAWAVLKRGLAYDKQARPATAGELIHLLALAQQSDSPEIMRPAVSTEASAQVQPLHPAPVELEPDSPATRGNSPEPEPPIQPVPLDPEPDPPRSAEPPQTSTQQQPAKRSFSLPLIVLLTVLLAGGGLFAWQTWFAESPQRPLAAPAPKPEWQARPAAEAVPPPEALIVFRDKLKDGTLGPVMVKIPAGEFLLGSPADEPGRDDDERQHPVAIDELFSIGQFEVTFEEYDRFAQATGRKKPSDENWGRNRRPAIHVTWFDAMAYAEWLSEQTGQNYRLPTEAEWEYAARAGTTTPFSFGNTISPEQANYDGQHSYNGGPTGVYRARTVPVGQFPPNAWGLHDMHGNVWEWTCSQYVKRYGSAEQQCKNKSYANALGVVRGGGWYFKPAMLRSANRHGLAPGQAQNFLGFRVVRD